MGAYLNALNEEGTRDDLMREVVRLYDENTEQRQWIAEATKTLTNLTGGGSEFFVRKGEQFRADLPFCAKRIREKIDTECEFVKATVIARKAAEQQLAAATKRIGDLEEENDRLVDDAVRLSVLTTNLSGRIRELEEGLREIAKAEGAYSIDQMEHAANCIINMQSIACSLLSSSQEEGKP